MRNSLAIHVRRVGSRSPTFIPYDLECLVVYTTNLLQSGLLPVSPFPKYFPEVSIKEATAQD